MTCKTCRHWGSWDADYDHLEGVGFGECGRIKDVGPTYERDDPGRAYRRTELALAVDMDRYAAGVITKPEFGCVLHSPADVPQ